jgi:aspartyl aminopeptidase
MPRDSNVLIAVLALGIAARTGAAQEAEKRSSWLTLSSESRALVEEHASEYKVFMREAKTELHFVREALRILREAGFTELDEASQWTPGARFYDVNRDRALSVIVAGRRDAREGFRVVGAHIDSPRLELKARPLYEKEEFALFQTNYHGGIKTYQWTNLPLALMGRVDLKDGNTVWISIGNRPEEPTFVIADLSPHIDADLRERKYRDVIEHEELDPLVGHIPAAEGGVKKAVLDHLRATYAIGVDDLVSAELALVPAMEPRDVGFDRGLMAIYGQDDRLSGYAALKAILDSPAPEHTAIAYLVDNEEAGNVNNTGADSSYLVDLMGRILHLQMGDGAPDRLLRQSLRATRVVSSDVNPGIDPIWPEAWEQTNAPRLGHGVNFKMYGHGFNANSEYTAWMRKILDDAGVPWQIATYKVGRAGGGTIGGALSDDNMEVIDIGVPVLSIHTPYSVSSKVDVYDLYRAMKAFFQAAP